MEVEITKLSSTIFVGAAFRASEVQSVRPKLSRRFAIKVPRFFRKRAVKTEPAKAKSATAQKSRPGEHKKVPTFGQTAHGSPPTYMRNVWITSASSV
jgi:hypothetical protein